MLGKTYYLKRYRVTTITMEGKSIQDLKSLLIFYSLLMKSVLRKEQLIKVMNQDTASLKEVQIKTVKGVNHY